MAHQRPGGLESAVEGQGAAEVEDCFLVLGDEGVVVAEDAVGLGAEFVRVAGGGGEGGEFGPVGQDVEEIAVDLEAVEAVGVLGDETVEELHGLLMVAGVVVE